MTITLALIAVTSAVSLSALYLNRKILNDGMLIPSRVIREGTWYELLTAGFLHASFTHLLVNMFVLFFFGIVLEQNLGVAHYLALYITGLLVSSLPSMVYHRDDPTYATVGASGGVESVLFGFIFLFPTESIYFILLPIPIPAWVFGLVFLAYSIYESKKGRGNVNHQAHIAGAVWGIVYMLIFVPNGLDHILTILGLI
ncbi:rhomboid family intramembrane serine protease [Rhodohalobacter sp. SW132]|uniref:rhomboid family intramembrane serine protease n=1 Tax=Rhodohalobacter sp. SW132 TaxID=2293433 RepID=UPI000E26599D|nr:rhomboid family intramembrane serine protease [Rhodohalobacter sp. SW132]REL24701.1 rhomboid family intramembrane serine protease [Rhodohalobacter sp. SW132]